MKCKCKDCGSSQVKIQIADTVIDPNKLKQEDAKNIIKNTSHNIWICLKCEDESNAYAEINGLKIFDPIDVISHIAEFGDSKNIKDFETFKKSIKKVNIEKAVETGNIDAVKEYINNGGDVNFLIDGHKLISSAIWYQQWDVALLLANDKNFDANKEDPTNQSTPIIDILFNKYRSKKMIDIIDILMKKGADLSHKSYGDDAFDLADLSGKKQHKQYIIDNFPEQYKEYQDVKKYNL